jgi:hypothetical protein
MVPVPPIPTLALTPLCARLSWLVRGWKLGLRDGSLRYDCWFGRIIYANTFAMRAERYISDMLCVLVAYLNSGDHWCSQVRCRRSMADSVLLRCSDPQTWALQALTNFVAHGHPLGVRVLLISRTVVLLA